jgi:hypothetical protein
MPFIRAKLVLSAIFLSSVIVFSACGKEESYSIVGKTYEIPANQTLTGSRDFESLQKNSDTKSAVNDLIKLATSKNAYRMIQSNWARNTRLNTREDGSIRNEPLRFAVLNIHPLNDKGTLGLQIKVLDTSQSQQTWWITLADLQKIAREVPTQQPVNKPE